METPANNNFVLTRFFSFERLMDVPEAVRHPRLYQLISSLLARNSQKDRIVCDVGNNLVAFAEQAHSFREMDLLFQLSQILADEQLPETYRYIGLYYRAVCVQRFGRGDVDKAIGILESVARGAPPKYKVRGLISLAANLRHRDDNQSALELYHQAARLAAGNESCDPYSVLGTTRMAAVILSDDGNHRDSLSILEGALPVAHCMRSLQPLVYYDYLNSLAVELCLVGRLQEARNASRIVLASPYARAYPEWRETFDEIGQRARYASRSTVAVTREAVEDKNLAALPQPRRAPTLTVGVEESHPPARILPFPTSIRSTVEQRERKEELAACEKRSIIANRLYEMLISLLNEEAIDPGLLEKVYRVFFKNQKLG